MQILGRNFFDPLASALLMVHIDTLFVSSGRNNIVFVLQGLIRVWQGQVIMKIILLFSRESKGELFLHSLSVTIPLLGCTNELCHQGFCSLL